MDVAHRTKKPNTHKKWLVWTGVAVVAVLLAGVLLELTETTDFINTRRAKQYVTTPASPDRTINEKTKGETPQDSNKQTPESDPKNDKADQGASTNTPLLEPTGPFVSNHHPNLSGSPAPNELQSTCTTTPGATCQIVFKNGNVTKSLPMQQTDKGGSAYWSWKLQDIDLNEGSWEVAAKAVMGDQTKTSTDSMKLEVKK